MIAKDTLPIHETESLPYWNARIEGEIKTFGEYALESLKAWAQKLPKKD